MNIEIDRKYYEKCKDCGEAIKDRVISRRKDVCDECWGRREWLMKNFSKYGLDNFNKVQKAMRGRKGKAKNIILSLQKEFGG